MDKTRTKPLIPPLSSRWARVGLTFLFTLMTSVALHAQDVQDEKQEHPRNQNSELRKHTWSFYAEGGLSWATEVWFQNLDAKRSYKQSPAVGGGIDFTIQPWVRVGAEYLWSRYRREQRFSELDTKTMPVKVYGNYMMNFHNAKLGVQFNFMELWPKRHAQWFNIWLGTGVGYTFAKGNEYSMTFSNLQQQNGQTTPISPSTIINNNSDVTLIGSVRTINRHEKFNTLYVPATLHIEADVTRRLTFGLKGEVDWLFNRKDIAPKNYIFGLATIRYNLVASRAKAEQKYYEGEISALNDRVNALQQEAAENKARADREAAERQRTEQKNAELQQRLSEQQNSMNVQVPAVQFSHFVQFDHNSSRMSRYELAHLKHFAADMRGKQLSIIAEASTPGTVGYNQKLSERRLKHVVKALVKAGLAKKDLHPQTAVGEQNGRPNAEGRRVTIKLVN